MLCRPRKSTAVDLGAGVTARVAAGSNVAPLTLSLSPWERERPLDGARPDSLSHGERAGVRGASYVLSPRTKPAPLNNQDRTLPAGCSGARDTRRYTAAGNARGSYMASAVFGAARRWHPAPSHSATASATPHKRQAPARRGGYRCGARCAAVRPERIVPRSAPRRSNPAPRPPKLQRSMLRPIFSCLFPPRAAREN